MYRIRQIFGLLSLLLASVGPLPLWLHQFQCHGLHCDGHHGVVQAGAVPSGAVGHVHPSGAQAAHQPLSDGHLCSGDVALETSFEPDLEKVDEQRVEVAELGSAHGHDCLVCFQLSQATAMDWSSAACKIASLFTQVQISQQPRVPAWSLGFYGCRAPPAV